MSHSLADQAARSEDLARREEDRVANFGRLDLGALLDGPLGARLRSALLGLRRSYRRVRGLMRLAI